MSDVTVSEVRVLACAEEITLRTQHRHTCTDRESWGLARRGQLCSIPVAVVKKLRIRIDGTRSRSSTFKCSLLGSRPSPCGATRILCLPQPAVGYGGRRGTPPGGDGGHVRRIHASKRTKRRCSNDRVPVRKNRLCGPWRARQTTLLAVIFVLRGACGFQRSLLPSQFLQPVSHRISTIYCAPRGTVSLG